MNHNLKIDDAYLEQKIAGDKLFEVRLNDSGYQKGDTVTYSRTEGVGKTTEYVYEITYVSSYMQQPNYVVFGERFLREVTV